MWNQCQQSRCTVEPPEPELRERDEERPSILLIDDDRDWALGMLRLLQRAGFAVDWAEDERAGLTRLDQSSPDAIVLDLHFPSLNGLPLLRQLRCNRRSVPILIVGRTDQPSAALQALREGATAFLMRPYPDEVLICTMRKLIEQTPRACQF